MAAPGIIVAWIPAERSSWSMISVFVDGRSAEMARASAAGAELLDNHPFDVGVINVHSANPAGAARIAQVLRHWGYRVHVASGSTDVGYLDGSA